MKINLPPSINKEGYTESELKEICKSHNVDYNKFNEELIGNTCMIIDGEMIIYHCDVENALHKLLNGTNLFFD